MEKQETLLPLSASQQEAVEEAVASYAAGVTPAIAKVLLARGIDRNTALMFRVGVVHDPFPGHEKFRGWISIPYLDRNGVGLTLRFRCPEKHEHEYHGKYMSLPDDPPRTFNIRAIHEATDTIHVAEGEFDAMVLTKVGLPAIAIPGVALWQGRHRRMLAGFSRVYVWGDPDDAGAGFARKITNSLRQAKAVRLRRGDVTDTYLAGGADALYGLIEESKK